jgi:hypothetical protein
VISNEKHFNRQKTIMVTAKQLEMQSLNAAARKVTQQNGTKERSDVIVYVEPTQSGGGEAAFRRFGLLAKS